MPIPFIIGAAAAVAGAVGVGAGAVGAKKMYDAKQSMESAQYIYELSMKALEEQNTTTCELMDKVGNYELNILKSFETFSNLLEQIQNRPQFKEIQQNKNAIPVFTVEELKKASVGAAAIIAGLSGVGLGVAGGVAASGATTAAVMALATASTGASISGLTGVAATNATLAFLGGGSIAAGGGGMALGTAVLGASTLGIGLLVGGAIFAFSGSKISDKADEAYLQACEIHDNAKEACERLIKIHDIGLKFYNSLKSINEVYETFIQRMKKIIRNKTDWMLYSDYEKRVIQVTVLLVGVLYSMCKVKLTVKDKKNPDNKIANTKKVEKLIDSSEKSVESILYLDKGC